MSAWANLSMHRETCRCGAAFEHPVLGPFGSSWASEAARRWRAEHQCPPPKPDLPAVDDDELADWEQELLDRELAEREAMAAEPTPIYDALTIEQEATR